MPAGPCWCGFLGMSSLHLGCPRRVCPDGPCHPPLNSQHEGTLCAGPHCSQSGRPPTFSGMQGCLNLCQAICVAPFNPITKGYLSLWLPRQAVVTAASTFGCVHLGLMRPILNVRAFPKSDMTRQLAATVRATTSQCINNVVAAKSHLFGNDITRFGTMTAWCATGGEWRLTNLGGFPLPLHIACAVLKKFNVKTECPTFTLLESEEDTLKDPVDTTPMYVQTSPSGFSSAG